MFSCEECDSCECSDCLECIECTDMECSECNAECECGCSQWCSDCDWRASSKSQQRLSVPVGVPLCLLAMASLPSVVAQSAGQSANDPSANSTVSCTADDVPSYSIGLHVGGIFVVFAVSGLGILGTTLLATYSKSERLAIVLQLVKMFGIGVIASTAWIHLLPDAFSQFSNPCLDSSWANYGTNYVGLFGLIAAFLVQLIEMVATDYKRKRTAVLNSSNNSLVLADVIESGAGLNTVANFVTADTPGNCIHGHLENNGLNINDESSIPETRNSFSFMNVVPVAHSGSTPAEQMSGTQPNPLKIAVSDPPSNELNTIVMNQSGDDLSTVLLEAGILFHSVIIGLTLGVTADGSFKTLLAAVCFHQMFEGMALGVLIGRLKLGIRSKGLLCLLYPLTTPIGIAIGVGVRNSYNSNSNALIITQGILDSLSAGILFYNTYTELMSEEVSHSPMFCKFSSKFKAVCMLCMYAGASAMAIIGIWA